MRRREFIRFVGCGFLVCPCVALAQQSGKQTKIGWLAPDSRDAPTPVKLLQVFRQRLENLGHIEGRDIAIEIRYADRNFDRLPGLAAQLVEQKVHRSQLTPAIVVAAALRGMRRRHLYVPLGFIERCYWYLKRLLPQTFQAGVAWELNRQLKSLKSKGADA